MDRKLAHPDNGILLGPEKQRARRPGKDWRKLGRVHTTKGKRPVRKGCGLRGSNSATFWEPETVETGRRWAPGGGAAEKSSRLLGETADGSGAAELV